MTAGLQTTRYTQSLPWSAPRPIRGRLLAWMCVPLLVGLLGPAAIAASKVEDKAKFFTTTAIEKADTQIEAIKKEYGKDLLIETFETVPSDIADKVKNKGRERDQAIEGWAREQFRRAGVDGVYVLITKKPGHVQVEVGNQTQKRDFTTRDRERLKNLLLAAFGKKEFDKGLQDGVSFVQRTLGENGTPRARRENAAPVTQVTPVGPVHRAPQINVPAAAGGMSWLWIILIIVIGFWLLRAIFRGISSLFGGGGGYRGGPGGYGGGMGGPGMGGPGYPGGGYPGGGGGGGGFMSGMLGGLFGAAAGNWMYDSVFRGGGGLGGASGGNFGTDPRSFGGGTSPEPRDTDSSGSGGDFGDDSAQADTGGGGDFGGGDSGGDSGGDFGGGDFGGGDSGGGDFGGGDFGGGDFGGGDFGGGGGDS